MAHNDQASIEYYSRGDLLLADAGEDKYVLNTNYGVVDIHHNTISLENPRTPFTLAGWSNSRSRGAYKGDAGGVITPVNITSIIQAPWIEGMDISERISSVVSEGFGQSQALSSPVTHERVVLYPDNDYFIIVDRMEGSQPWVYRNIF